MSDDEVAPGQVPTEQLTTEQRVILVQSLLITPRVLEHLHGQGLINGDRQMMRANCCKPDGGSCCVNAH